MSQKIIQKRQRKEKKRNEEMTCPLEEFHFTMVSLHFYKDFHFQVLLNHFNKKFIFRTLQLTFKKKSSNKSRSVCKFARAFAVVQELSRVQLSATPWTAARQASLSFTGPILGKSAPSVLGTPSSVARLTLITTTAPDKGPNTNWKGHSFQPGTLVTHIPNT